MAATLTRRADPPSGVRSDRAAPPDVPPPRIGPTTDPRLGHPTDDTRPAAPYGASVAASTGDQRETSALQAMSDAVLAIAAELSVEAVLQRLVDAARELAGARYAALGVPDGEGAFEQFITAGMSDELVAAMGPLPRTHGLLGAMLESERPYRTLDIRRDSRFRGWWPRAHPQMRSFLGVPIVARGGIIGAFYLTEKVGADAFDDEDQQLIEMLAAHAAIAIENARLYERSRELTVVEERNRVARELHDSVTQNLFGVVLAAEAASTLIDRDPGAARVQLDRVRELARAGMEELRSLIFELRPAALADEGLAPTLRKHVGVLRRVYQQDIALKVAGAPRPGSPGDGDVLRIAQEALHNALRHAHASRIDVALEARDGRLVLTVADDGVGFDPAAAAVRGRRLGLTSMEERARALGGTLAIDSRPGEGTRVRLEVARG
jgi:signal transduction histidine kinase